MAVLSVWEGNPYGPPPTASRERLGVWVSPEHLYRTDRDSTVVLSTDGACWWAWPFD
ncbi:MAG: hypothetical protein VW450_09230 [Chloroflexota bacterium]